jgi:ABC-2 type transport system permease protein
MFARAAVGGASALEVALSMVLMAATVMAVAWVAGRIYKVGILMAGKRPTLPEILRWVREA